MLPSQIKAIKKKKKNNLGEKRNGSDQLEEFGNKPERRCDGSD